MKQSPKQCPPFLPPSHRPISKSPAVRPASDRAYRSGRCQSCNGLRRGDPADQGFRGHLQAVGATLHLRRPGEPAGEGREGVRRAREKQKRRADLRFRRRRTAQPSEHGAAEIHRRFRRGARRLQGRGARVYRRVVGSRGCLFPHHDLGVAARQKRTHERHRLDRQPPEPRAARGADLSGSEPSAAMHQFMAHDRRAGEDAASCYRQTAQNAGGNAR